MRPVPAGSTRIPQLPDPFVPRARLLTVLDDERSHTTLVCAPAGFGKTALLAHWARAAASARPVAWANLSSATGNLWDAVLPALLSCSGVPEDSLLHELTRRAPASVTMSFTADVLAALDALPKQIALILHDIHEIVAPTARTALEALLTARPVGVRLILCSRWDTPPSVWGMRSAGHLSEIRADRLRFSPDETREMLRLSKLDLEVGQARELHSRIDGWPIGARLACVALRGRAGPAPFLERFAHVDQPVADFLVGEVLTGPPAADRDLLARVHPLVAPYLRGEHLSTRERGNPVLTLCAALARTEAGLVNATTTETDNLRCLALLAGVAGIDGDYSGMATAATGADEVATSGGWELSPLATAARWMLACSALLRSEPVEAYRLTLEALLIEAGASVIEGNCQTARRALRDARASGASRAPAARLDGIERELLVRLPSALSIDQIARELRIPPTEATTRIRAIYRKLGVSSRRSAVSVAQEEGLLR